MIAEAFMIVSAAALSLTVFALGETSRRAALATTRRRHRPSGKAPC